MGKDFKYRHSTAFAKWTGTIEKIKSLDFTALCITVLRRTLCYKKKNSDMLKAPYFSFKSWETHEEALQFVIVNSVNLIAFVAHLCHQSDSSLWENSIWPLSLPAKFCFKNWVTKYLLFFLRIELLLKREREEFFFRLKWQTVVLNLSIKGNELSV